MKRILQLTMIFLLVGAVQNLSAQRYQEEVFTLDEITVTSDIIFGTNIDFLFSNLAGATVPAEIGELQTAAAAGTDIPEAYFDPEDTSTALKVTHIAMDVYQPDPLIDTETARPVMVYVHTGNFLPPVINGSPNGLKTDSAGIVLCQQWAMRGYVAVSVDYRLGWNPISDNEDVRRGTLLNAVFRAIHDVKKAVRTIKIDAAADNTYGINPDQIVLYGQGSGGYVTQAYTTLDDAATELYLTKFLADEDNNISYVDTTAVGNLEGLGGSLTLHQADGASSEVQMSVNAGGALADESWLEAGDVPMCSINTIRDDFAPFNSGIVIVPVTQEEVVEVQGPNVFIQKANDLGNNDVFADLPSETYTDAARALYGTTHDVSLGGMITVASTPEGLFPVLLPLTSYLTNQASPWEWWDPNGPLATAMVPGGGGVTTHQASSQSNPDMSPEKGRAYLDSINGYIIPRIACALDLPGNLCAIPPAPENDDCAGAIDIDGSTGGAIGETQTTDLVNNIDATTNDDDPSVGEDGDCWFGDPLVSNTVWFTFTGDGNEYTINTECSELAGEGYISNGDTQVIAFSGACGDFTEVDCNEDAADAPTDNWYGEVTIDTEDGVEYYLMIDGYQGLQGDFCINVTNNGVGINELDLQKLVKVYPNPAEDMLRIEADGVIETIAVYNALGQMVVLENGLSTGNTTLDINNLDTGIYTVQVVVNGTTLNKRIIKK